MPYDTNKFAPMWVKHETKQKCKDRKLHRNQPYDEVVTDALKKADLYDKMIADKVNGGK